jgi:hypothetical protein
MSFSKMEVKDYWSSVMKKHAPAVDHNYIYDLGENYHGMSTKEKMKLTVNFPPSSFLIPGDLVGFSWTLKELTKYEIDKLPFKHEAKKQRLSEDEEKLLKLVEAANNEYKYFALEPTVFRADHTLLSEGGGTFVPIGTVHSPVEQDDSVQRIHLPEDSETELACTNMVTLIVDTNSVAYPS